MMGKTHYTIAALYYILFCITPVYSVLPFTPSNITIVGIAAAIIGGMFPDADADHSLFNKQNPIFFASNKTIDALNATIKWIFSFIYFCGPAALIINYMYKKNDYSKGLIVISLILFILALNGAKIGERIYIPILTNVLKLINNGAIKLKKVMMMLIYISLGFACVYFNNGHILGVIWGAVFIAIAIFPHRTFLHSPEGIFIVTIGVMHLEQRIGIAVSNAFFIGYFSHLYLGDIFTKSGVPVSAIPLIMKKTRLHRVLKRNVLYRKIYYILNIRISIPIIKTGSNQGKAIEGLYISALVFFTVFIKMKYL